jgi:hypothetical protein
MFLRNALASGVLGDVLGGASALLGKVRFHH